MEDMNMATAKKNEIIEININLYEMLAKTDPGMESMLTEYKNLLGI